MFTRMTGLLIVPMWIGAMGWLVANDVLPGITAKAPPPLHVNDWLREDGRKTQYAISTPDGRIGTIWTDYLIDATAVRRDDIVFIDKPMADITPLRAMMSSVFTADGKLDEFTIRLTNSRTRMDLHGERFHADFSFSFEMGGMPGKRTFKIPLADAGMITGAFRPFASLNDLTVGDRWRMQVFNPIASMTGFGKRFIPLVVEVTGSEVWPTSDGPVQCMVVESSNAKAWIDQNGLVRRQTFSIPSFGDINITYEEGYDESAVLAVRSHVFKRR
ncbi:MAG: hypothetical protein ACPGXK_03310 [Phycisphaerae bacterium]